VLRAIRGSGHQLGALIDAGGRAARTLADSRALLRRRVLRHLGRTADDARAAARSRTCGGVDATLGAGEACSRSAKARVGLPLRARGCRRPCRAVSRPVQARGLSVCARRATRWPRSPRVGNTGDRDRGRFATDGRARSRGPVAALPQPQTGRRPGRREPRAVGCSQRDRTGTAMSPPALRVQHGCRGRPPRSPAGEGIESRAAGNGGEPAGERAVRVTRSPARTTAACSRADFRS